jgi:oligopeptide transport system substrate-binding protein
MLKQITSRAIFFCGVLCLLLSAQIGCAKKFTEPTGQVLRISQRNEPATLDPHLATLPDEFFVIRALSEGLLSPAPEGGQPQPGVATSWSASPDGLVYTFQLRSDTRWSNGDPVTASDFVYSVRRVLSPALAAPKAALFFPLKNAAAFYAGREKDFSTVGVRALDDHRLEFTLNEPTADFPALVASGPWIPVHRSTIEKAGRIDQRNTSWTRPENFVGNGPFILSTWRANQEIAVTYSKTYQDSAKVPLREIHFIVFDNTDSEERAFRAHQLDVTMSVPFTKITTYHDTEPTLLRQIPLHETRYLSLNVTRPPLNDSRVRRALALALDRTAITGKVLRGGQQPAFSYLPPGLGGYESKDLLVEDKTIARQLLDEAGYPGGRNFPRLELTSWATTPAVLEAIQQMWRQELGIEITLVQREARTHLASLVSGDYTIALATAIPDYDGVSDLCDDLRSEDPGNYPHWKNADYDRLIADAERVTSPTARNAAYHQAEKILLESMPLIPLYFNAQNFLVQTRVKNWRADRLWTRFYQGVSVE